MVYYQVYINKEKNNVSRRTHTVFCELSAAFEGVCVCVCFVPCRVWRLGAGLQLQHRHCRWTRKHQLWRHPHGNRCTDWHGYSCTGQVQSPERYGTWSSMSCIWFFDKSSDSCLLWNVFQSFVLHTLNLVFSLFRWVGDVHILLAALISLHICLFFLSKGPQLFRDWGNNVCFVLGFFLPFLHPR